MLCMQRWQIMNLFIGWRVFMAYLVEVSRFFKFIDIYYLMKKMLDNTTIHMIPGLPLWVEIHYDFGDDFSQQFPGMIAGMALCFFLNTLAFQLLLRPSPNSGPLLGPSGPPHLSYL